MAGNSVPNGSLMSMVNCDTPAANKEQNHSKEEKIAQDEHQPIQHIESSERDSVVSATKNARKRSRVGQETPSKRRKPNPRA